MDFKIDLEKFGLPYGVKTVKAKAKGTGYVDSAYSNSLSYNSAPRVIPEQGYIAIYNLRSDVTSIEVYIDGALVVTQAYDHVTAATPFIIDLSELTINTYIQHPLYVVAKGDGVPANSSTTVLYGAGPVYGVSGLRGDNIALTRTDDAEGLSYAINSSTGAISSDFNDVFPWNAIKLETDADGNAFVTWPDMYFRIGTDAENCLTDIAVSNVPRNVGKWYKVNSFSYGRFGASESGGKLKSVSGVSRKANATRAQFRAWAAANGDGYRQLDLYHRSVLLFLWWIEWATKNSESIMTGKTAATGSGYVSTGGTDQVETPSGFNPTTKQMRYHYIEDFVGNYLEFVDGFVGTSSALYATTDASKFSDGSAGLDTLSITVPTTSGNCITAFGWDEDHPFLIFPSKTNNSNYNTGFCDYVEKSSYPVLYTGAYGNNTNAYCGVSYFNRYNAAYSYSNIGGRLLKTPSAGV